MRIITSAIIKLMIMVSIDNRHPSPSRSFLFINKSAVPVPCNEERGSRAVHMRARDDDDDGGCDDGGCESGVWCWS